MSGSVIAVSYTSCVVCDELIPADAFVLIPFRSVDGLKAHYCPGKHHKEITEWSDDFIRAKMNGDTTILPYVKKQL